MRFLLILIMFILVGCSGQHTASVKVTGTFAANAGAFGNGLFIEGQRVGGIENFSIGLTGTDEVKVAIPLGTWKFRVVGWASGTEPLRGVTYCGNKTVVLSEVGQLITLEATTNGCLDSEINGSDNQLSGNNFKGLVVSSCGGLNNPSTDTANDLYVNPVYNPCGEAGVPSSLKKTFPAYKIIFHNKKIGEAPTQGLVSNCQYAQTPSYIKIPTKIPVSIRFYEDTLCSTEASLFHFKNGLASLGETRNTQNFDWTVTSDSSKYFVHLPSGDSRRGTTPFLTESPIFRCSTGLQQCPKFASTSRYHFDLNEPGTIKLGNLGNVCKNATSASPNFRFNHCVIVNGITYLRMTFKAAGIFEFNYDGAPYEVEVGNIDFPEDRAREVYMTLKRLLGFQGTGGTLNKSLYDDFEYPENNLGVLQNVTDELLPIGVGGVMWDQVCAVSSIGTIERTYQRGGDLMKVRFQSLSGDESLAPAFISQAATPLLNEPEYRYNNRLTISRFKNVVSGYVTEKVIDLSCDNFTTELPVYSGASAQVRMGRMEEQIDRNLGDLVLSSKTLLHWNTSLLNTSRFDVYRTKSYKRDGTYQNIENSYYRVQKSGDDISGDSYRINGMTYKVQREGSSFDQTVRQFEIDGINASVSLKDLFYLKKENSTIGQVFSDKLYQTEMNKIRAGYVPSNGESKQSVISSAPTGEFIQAHTQNTELSIHYFSNGVFGDESTIDSPNIYHADLSQNGIKMAVVYDYGSDIKLKTFDGTTWDSQTISVGLSIDDLKVAILNDGKYLVSYIANGDVWWLNGVHGTAPNSATNISSQSFISIEIAKNSTEFYLFTNGSIPSTTQKISYCKTSFTATGCSLADVASRVSSNPFTYMAPSIVNNNQFTITYVHDGLHNFMSSTLPTVGGTQVQYTQDEYGIKTFSPSDSYSNYDDSLVLRTSAVSGTDVFIPMPFIQPTMNSTHSFEMKPASLQQGMMDSLYTGTLAFRNLGN